MQRRMEKLVMKSRYKDKIIHLLENHYMGGEANCFGTVQYLYGDATCPRYVDVGQMNEFIENMPIKSYEEAVDGMASFHGLTWNSEGWTLVHCAHFLGTLDCRNIFFHQNGYKGIFEVADISAIYNGMFPNDIINKKGWKISNEGVLDGQRYISNVQYYSINTDISASSKQPESIEIMK